ncbi:ImmA/IrrE family metallo-endopeptidase [Paenibacillus sp. ACRRX]|uniref:ImmA/IrrE family metallo-endopeptidase n=1 Tax=Paenibacillus sp. ACRRX TaxID=2918206 RepID=UPI001EF48A53|nr:ImmA/IrrE family metallo-endopeptidase [Paenibacillus sp. ACRRX]MCG7407726.1 ImmA/IrrE family metallo-endopeptidase [Paenibacillus sp. ACRRX]
MQIKVAGTHYEVVREKLLGAAENIYGDANFTIHRIRIDESITPERAQQTLIHELLHAIFYEAGYDEQDEDVIRRVSTVLYQVLADNDVLSLMEEVAEKAVIH